ncbi:MAG: metalloregulator ArsR/SmtB family transcription factor [Methylotetracoccus sp.]|jgi:DNA-binding transcriptional ArsR family regulator|nr:metalloregulator ArsR/SmtB family transcription factor [Methylotetracoccus sp.]
MKTDLAVKALAALAQETRLSIFRLLVQAGEPGIAAGEIARNLGVPNATLSFHLKELVNADLVRARQESRFIYYAANFAVMNELLGFLTENCCGGQPCGTDTVPCMSGDSQTAQTSPPRSAPDPSTTPSTRGQLS